MANKLLSALLKNTYAAPTSYTVGDIVDYNGSSYANKLNSTGNLPTNTTYWALLAEKGTTGNTGSTGATGSQGVQGNPGSAGVGDVVGPASAVDSNFASYNTTTGKLIKDSGSKASDFQAAGSYAGALGADDNYVTDAEKASLHGVNDVNTSSAPALGADDNYVTDAEKAALHAPGSDNQDLSALAPLASPTFTGTVTLPVGLTGVVRVDTGVVSVDTDVTDIVAAGTESAAGKLELATDGEMTTGTDTVRAITPANAKVELDKKLALSGGTMTGNLTLGENASIALDPAGSADGKYTGITVTGTGGATIAFGDLVSLSPANSRWRLVDISVAAGSAGDARGLLGMAVTSSSDGGSLTVLLSGIIRADANFPALTIGSTVYATTAGDIVVTQPSTTDHVIRVVGSALTSDEIYFSPSADYITRV